MKKYFLSICAACALLLACTAGAQTTHYQMHSSTWGKNYLNIEGNFTFNPDECRVTYSDGLNEYKFMLKGDSVSEFYVDGKKIPADQIHLYKAVIEKVKEQIKKDEAQAKEDRKQAEIDRQQAEEDRKQAVRDQAQAAKDREQAEEDRKQSVKDQAQAEEDRKQAEEDRKQALRDAEEAKREAAQGEQDRKQAEEDRKQAEEDRKQAVRDQAQAEEDRKQAEVDRKQAEEDRAMMKALVQEIVAEKIVPDAESVKSFCLSDDGFTVNGKKQPDAVFTKFKEKFLQKYLKHPGWSLSYGSFSGRNGIWMNSNDLKEK